MEFTYKKSNELFNSGAGVTDNTGVYNGEETITVNIDENGFIVENGTEVTLTSSNENHVILMDMINGSEGFEPKDGSLSTIEVIGPYINHKVYDSYPSNVEYDLTKCTIVDGVVNYVHSEYNINSDEIKANAQATLNNMNNAFDRTVSTDMKALYSKAIAICEWIINIWDDSTIPAYKIIIPTIDTLSDFNEPV